MCSEMFDHTSLIRFLERRFGVHEPNITPWRRAVCGDLTSAFDFESASDHVPALPNVAAYKPNQSTTPPSYHPMPPAVGSVPTQEHGVRPSRRLGYRLHVGFEADPGKLNLAVKNQGSLGVGLQARSLTVPAARTATRSAPAIDRGRLANPGTYDLSLHGPNGFFRHFAGSPRRPCGSRSKATTTSASSSSGSRTAAIAARSSSTSPTRTAPDRHITVHGTSEITIDTHHSGGWYDIALSTPSDTSFSYQLAGRLESGGRLTSDPQLGR